MVRNHEAEKGAVTSHSVRRRPYLITTPALSPPKSAPSSDRLAIHEPCCSVMLKLVIDAATSAAVALSAGSEVACIEASAGEVYPLLRPTAKGPKETAKADKI